MKLLLFSTNNSSRLSYITHFIFDELMGVECIITQSQEVFQNYNGPKINYSFHLFSGNHFTILPVPLLFETTIIYQKIDCFKVNNYTAFFKINNADFSFDIFAASFYLLSRYEEYLPHKKDMYGRFAHENSLAFKERFLQLPLINIWVKDFILALKNRFSFLQTTESEFTFLPTYDIDIAFSYRHKGFVRNLGGFLKNPSLQRLKVLCCINNDPFDVYDQLDDLHKKYKLKPFYFFLIAVKNSLYDKNISPTNNAMVNLIKTHAKKYTVGIHPSWQSGDNISLLKEEKNELEKITKQPINISRQHYIRFNLPEGYNQLIKNKISDDHSMGYGSINGFRASVASSFFWYDLSTEQQTSLRIHPFCYMEANSFYEQHLTPAEAFNELMEYYTICKEVNGTLITIWHNHLLGTDKIYTGWAEIYQKFLERIGEEPC